MYNLIKPIFFKYDPEVIHHKVFNWIKTVNKIPGVSSVIRGIYCLENKKLEREVFGIKFKNPVGLAAGFDKDAKLFEELNNFGFGFIEVGTITPVGQPGNDKPRMFRLVDDEALINRMGFNNEGVDEMVIRLKNRKNSSLIIGGNIGKNKVTPNEVADEDFVKCFEKLFDYVDYFVVNVSSPNTPGLRDLQDKEPLKKLLFRLQQLNQAKVKSKPILLKIAPDLTNEQLDDIIEIVQDTKIAGVIATNTTISRDGLQSNPELVKQMGGLSGIPVKDRSTEVIRYLSQKSNKSFPIVGVGGIHSGDDAIEKLKAGASLVQIYTGFIYKGPGLVREINQKILEQGL
ncbi:dihydroorotate dehydrogenase (quinone) [Solitalea longa]|uniref:Dihydroorotate dehydrogenase (quinone) n=1 Tax=Solitalea longa TaxID=2079460 RepID=A0A2S5A1E5_9SPHI|nr:quinone-dependent dihydroorotate dehydrogenase [Solitalea longa]POY36129.1 dihydroorotate dehydrogenase (quinone) [Solitalea longa]